MFRESPQSSSTKTTTTTTRTESHISSSSKTGKVHKKTRDNSLVDSLLCKLIYLTKFVVNNLIVSKNAEYSQVDDNQEDEDGKAIDHDEHRKLTNQASNQDDWHSRRPVTAKHRELATPWQDNGFTSNSVYHSNSPITPPTTTTTTNTNIAVATINQVLYSLRLFILLKPMNVIAKRKSSNAPDTKFSLAERILAALLNYYKSPPALVAYYYILILTTLLIFIFCSSNLIQALQQHQHQHNNKMKFVQSGASNATSSSLRAPDGLLLVPEPISVNGQYQKERLYSETSARTRRKRRSVEMEGGPFMELTTNKPGVTNIQRRPFVSKESNHNTNPAEDIASQFATIGTVRSQQPGRSVDLRPSQNLTKNKNNDMSNNSQYNHQNRNYTSYYFYHFPHNFHYRPPPSSKQTGQDQATGLHQLPESNNGSYRNSLDSGRAAERRRKSDTTTKDKSNQSLLNAESIRTSAFSNHHQSGVMFTPAEQESQRQLLHNQKQYLNQHQKHGMQTMRQQRTLQTKQTTTTTPTQSATTGTSITTTVMTTTTKANRNIITAHRMLPELSSKQVSLVALSGVQQKQWQPQQQQSTKLPLSLRNNVDDNDLLTATTITTTTTNKGPAANSLVNSENQWKPIVTNNLNKLHASTKYDYINYNNRAPRGGRQPAILAAHPGRLVTQAPLEDAGNQATSALLDYPVPPITLQATRLHDTTTGGQFNELNRPTGGSGGGGQEAAEPVPIRESQQTDGGRPPPPSPPQSLAEDMTPLTSSRHAAIRFKESPPPPIGQNNQWGATAAAREPHQALGSHVHGYRQMPTNYHSHHHKHHYQHNQADRAVYNHHHHFQQQHHHQLNRQPKFDPAYRLGLGHNNAHPHHPHPYNQRRRPRLNSGEPAAAAATVSLDDDLFEIKASRIYKRVLLCDKTLVSLDYVRNIDLGGEPRPDGVGVGGGVGGVGGAGGAGDNYLDDHEFNEINDNFIGAADEVLAARSSTDSLDRLAVDSNYQHHQQQHQTGQSNSSPSDRVMATNYSSAAAAGNIAPTTNGTTLVGTIVGDGAIRSTQGGGGGSIKPPPLPDNLVANESSLIDDASGGPLPSSVDTKQLASTLDRRYSLNSDDLLIRCDMWDLEKGLKSRKPPESVLRMAIKADFDTVRDAINRCRQLSERTLPPDDEYRDGLEIMSTEDLISLFSIKRGLIPGTKWCGLGDQANSYNDLGPKHRIDICCRAHDHCPIRSKPFRNDYGVLNIGLYTKSHCDCDADFYRCLREVRSRTADMLGNLYFNVMKLQCMREERLKVCRKMKPIALGFERCIRYEDSPVKRVFKFTTPPVAY